jgi:hypothetical protein
VNCENTQIADIYIAITIEVALCPALACAAIVGCQNAQITDIDLVIDIRIAGEATILRLTISIPN